MDKKEFLPLGDLLFMKWKDSQIRIKDYFKLNMGKTPPTKNREYYENGVLPWLNGGKLTDLYFLTDKIKPSKLISETARTECKLLTAQPNSIVFSNVNTDKDRIVWVSSFNTSYYLGEHIWQINSGEPKWTATLFFVLRELDFSLVSAGSVFSEVQRKVFMNMKINWVSNPKRQKVFYKILNWGNKYGTK